MKKARQGRARQRERKARRLEERRRREAEALEAARAARAARLAMLGPIAEMFGERSELTYAVERILRGPNGIVVPTVRIDGVRAAVVMVDDMASNQETYK